MNSSLFYKLNVKDYMIASFIGLVALVVSVNECACLTSISVFEEGAILSYTSICSLPSTNLKVFLLQVSEVFCFLKCEDPDLLYIPVVNLAVRQACSGDTFQFKSDVTRSFNPQ